VEEHVAVLEQLRVAFEAPQDEGAERVARHATAGRCIEVWVGLGEILSRGLQADVPAIPQAGLALKQASDAHSDAQRLRQVPYVDESSRRFLCLVDVSDTGFGFEATEKESMGIGVGDLVGLRLSDEDRCVLGRVVRRVPGQVEGRVIIGVRSICNAPQALTLSRTRRQDRADDDSVFVYVPGDEDSGAHDAFLVPERVLQEQTSHDTCVGDDIFTIQLNRVRRKGRGWALMGFEILAAKRVGSTPKFELVGMDVDYGNAFDREIGSRLL
jgi:hypothetical protein